MNNNIFSQHQLNTWKDCPKRYYFKYIKNINWAEPLSESNIIGNNLHSLIYYYLNGQKIDHLLKDADSKITERWQAYQNLDILNNQVIATEYNFLTRLSDSNYWLQGRVDAIFYDKKKNKYIIADWKTGKTLPANLDNNFQCLFYLYSIHKSKKLLKLSFQEEDLEFQFIKITENPEFKSVRYSKDQSIKHEQILLNIINNIVSTENFIKNPGQKCKTCKFEIICE